MLAQQACSPRRHQQEVLNRHTHQGAITKTCSTGVVIKAPARPSRFNGHLLNRRDQQGPSKDEVDKGAEEAVPCPANVVADEPTGTKGGGRADGAEEALPVPQGGERADTQGAHGEPRAELHRPRR